MRRVAAVATDFSSLIRARAVLAPVTVFARALDTCDVAMGEVLPRWHLMKYEVMKRAKHHHPHKESDTAKAHLEALGTALDRREQGAGARPGVISNHHRLAFYLDPMNRTLAKAHQANEPAQAIAQPSTSSSRLIGGKSA